MRLWPIMDKGAVMEKNQKKPVSSLVLAYIEDHPKAVMLLRRAQQRAQELDAKWRAIYIETPAQVRNSEDGAHERMLRLMTLATQMGGEVAHIEGESVEQGMRKHLESEKARAVLFILGNMESDIRWSRWWPRTLTQRLMRLARKYTKVEEIPLAGPDFSRGFWAQRIPEFNMRNILYALGAVGVAYGCAALMEWLLPPALFRVNIQNVTLIFMIACAFVAGRYGLIPGLIASLVSFLTVNHFFMPAFHVTRAVSITDSLNMILFLSAAVLISLFTSQTRGYAQRAARRELGTQALFTLYRIATNAFTRQQALEKLQRKLTRMLDMEVAFFISPVLNPERIEAVYPADLILKEADRNALEICWKSTKTTGIGSPVNPGTEWRFEPMLSPGGEAGVIGIRPYKNKKLDPWYGRLLTAIADQTASVLEHIDLERSMEATRIREEREKLRSMLLSSVSHDLKTPLAGIIGALSVYQSLGDRLPVARRSDLMETALEEAHRLDSFISNILDMTRLESGKIEFHQDWHDMQSIVQQVAKRLQHRLRRHSLTVHPMPKNVEVCIDIMMTEQVVQNLIDNACKYTPAGTPIEISARTEAQGFLLEVRDHGAGLPPDKLAQVFDKYARLHKEDSQVAGTGLGLAICRAIMAAQGGWVTAANHPNGGAVFTLCLPRWREMENEKHVA